ncbi:MAG: peptidogalycan biosysnthesis protein, partial [Parvularculaceae bacterium]
MMSVAPPTHTAQLVNSLSDIPRADWDRLANPLDQPFHPFLAYDFLASLEQSGSVSAAAGWVPRHLVISQADEIIAAAPLYLKGHSQGEYIFDHAWADAYTRAGGEYYPKLLCSVPFTPVPGPRLLAKDESARALLIDALRGATSQMGISSLH